MPVQISICETVDAYSEDVFTAATSIDARNLIQKKGPLPGIINVEGHDAPWAAVGDQRRHTLSDKSSVCEELVSFAPGHSFAYRLSEFTGPFASLARSARADWHFTPLGADKTKIDWTYVFTPTGAVAEPVLWFIVKLFWPGYLKAALRRVKQKAETRENRDL